MLRLTLWIALGGALGSVGRFWLTELMVALLGETFPWGTLLVNVSGSFLIGFIAAASMTGGRMFLDSDIRHFIMIGILGGYTTFSSFSLQTLNLAHQGHWLYAGLYIVASVVLCLLGVWVGHLLALQFNAS